MGIVTPEIGSFVFSFFQINPTAPSITDWIQAIGVIFASVGLLINFYYQRKTLGEQLRSRDIEEERDRRAIMPWVEFSVAYNEETQEYILKFKCVGHDGKFLFIVPFLEEIGEYNLVETGFKEGQSGQLVIPKETIDRISSQLGADRKFIKVQYMDIDSRPYEQYVFLTTMNSMYISEPMQYIHIRIMEEASERKAKSWLRFFKPKRAIQ